ncbi:hypothetical protein [Streptomyces sp. AK04-3B]|uniref:hypothetical protein n=1 Tax=unclassified Streptomyces TaxID=2593676 RepID=UPI0029B43072|nr:hypothetical protein [Streptomyces sp. AK04-3B]MDX3800618.1 hypothetical protein [Streptomyces sp. AK04-3B]
MFSQLVQPEFLNRTTQRDVPELFQSALDAGWAVEVSGAWVLRFFSQGYRGNRSSFTDLTGYEAAINGRAIPDFDLSDDDPIRVEVLIRRAYSFAHCALFLLREMPNSPPGSAYISIGPTLYDENVVTGSVTFCVRREQEGSYLADISQVALSGILVVETEDCVSPLG